MTGKKNGAANGHKSVAENVRQRAPSIDLAAYEIEPAVIALVSREVCVRHRVIPVSRIGGSLVLAVTGANDSATLDALASLTGLKIEPVLATADEIAAAIAKYYGRS